MFWGRLRVAGPVTAALAAVSVGPALAVAASTPGPAAPVPTITTPTTPTTTVPSPQPPPKPAVSAKVRIYLPDAMFVHRQPVTVPKRDFHVGGVVTPYVEGQWVTVRVMAGRRLIKSYKLRLKPSRNRRYGHFREHFSSPVTGRLTVQVSHVATAQMKRFRSERTLSVLDENVGFGSTGTFVQLIQQRLAALHFYIPQTGVYDSGTGLAIDAYHRLLHWGTYQNLDGRTISFLLDGFGAFPVRFPKHGRHAEGNLSLQLLALADNSQVQLIFPISSGKPSTPTILGDFRVYSRVPGYLPDGMYYSSFFYSGYAIHGYDPAPDYPASHGCMRLPIADAITAFNWLAYGDWVDTYY
jgi:L,D-transpeptidase catalytic domain